MENFNIVDIINKNQNINFTNENNDKLIQKIKQNFTEEEQKMFIASFYTYLNYDEYDDFVISLDDLWNWIGFSTKSKAKELLLKNFSENINYKTLNVDKNDKNSIRGGHNKEIFLLNVNTFKSYCLIAGTEKAKKIHRYYIKLESILHQVIKEQNNEFKNQILTHVNKINELENNNKKLIKDKLMEKHNLLLKQFDCAGSLIYIAKIKTFDDMTYGIKIGESRIGISDRYNEHKSSYDECTLLECFSVQRSKDFESFIHNHESIKPHRINNLKGHENERELFLIGNGLSYNLLLNIINTNIKTFNNYNQEHEIKILELNIKKIEAEKKHQLDLTNSNIINEIMNTNKLLLNKIELLEKKIDILTEKLNSSQLKNTTNFNEPLKTLGPKLQQIDPQTLKIIKVYDSISECLKSNCEFKRSSITKSIKDNSVYRGFRWCSVDRELDSNILHNIQPTAQTNSKTQNIGYIAKLNADKTEILNVYLDRKVASISNGFESDSALDNPVKKFSIARGFYYTLYNSCSDQLKKSFVEKNKSEPILYRNGIGQFNLENKLIQEFITKYDCERTLGIGSKSMSKALEKNIPYNGFYYKRLDEKIKCFDN